jgi:methylmalonyl-CoA/ethylmalonyl-CoA epimerase
MNLGALHHIAIAVPRIEDALPFFAGTLGLRAGPVRELPDQRVRAAFLGEEGQRIELVEPLDADSGVGRFVAERGKPALHHVCYVVEDLAGTLSELERLGVELIDRAPRRGVEGRVAFVHPRGSGGVLLELVDRASLRQPIP